MLDPRSLVELREDMREFHRSISPDEFFAVAGETLEENGVHGTIDVSNVLWNCYDQFLQGTEMLYVSRGMTAKILEAAQTLPDFMPMHSDVPIPTCLAYFEGLEMSGWDLGVHGKGRRTSSAFSWDATGEGAASRFLIGHYIDFGSGVEFEYKRTMRAGMRALGLRPPRLVPNSVVAWQTHAELRDEFNTKFEPQHRGGTAPMLKTLWRLMQQEEISSVQEMEPSRASAKRIRRAGIEPGKVRVVDLRQRNVHSHPREEHSREYSHRWKVRGHWRQQWYPSQKVHRPKWIEEHLRGPEDAPLLERDTVYRLR